MSEAVECNMVVFTAYGQKHCLYTTKDLDATRTILSELCDTAHIESFDKTKVLPLQYLNHNISSVTKHLEKIQSYVSI
jgi:hypothetical protein